MVFVYGVLLALLCSAVVRTPYEPKQAQAPAPAACVKLVRSEPFPPDESPMPNYPEAAKAARVEGEVSFHLEVGSGCAAEEITVDDGPQMLREAVENGVRDWKYCGAPEGQEIRAAVAFRLSCPAK